jgi:hypothetical protein
MITSSTEGPGDADGAPAEAAPSGNARLPAASRIRPLFKPKILRVGAMGRRYTVVRADVAELVDAHGSGPCGRKPVEVQVLSSASLFEGLTEDDALLGWAGR